MTPLKKLSFLYIVTLLVAGAAIVGVLHLGSTLPPPQDPTAVLEKSTAVAPSAESAFTGFTKSLQTNFDHPLSRLLVQLLVIISLAQVAGRVCRSIGQPAVIGEIVTGILLGPSLLGLLAPEAFAFVFPA